MDELLNAVESVKKKLTSRQYKKLMDRMGDVSKKLRKPKSQIVQIKILYVQHIVATNERGVQISSESREICLYQPKFDARIMHYDGNFHEFEYGMFADKLTKKNLRIFKELKRTRYVNCSQKYSDVNVVTNDIRASLKKVDDSDNEDSDVDEDFESSEDE